MFRKTVSAVMLCLLLASMLTLVFKIPSVKADGGLVYIYADGSISPSIAPIYTADNVSYTLTGNLSYPTYEGVVVERNSIVFDGNGFMVQGNNSGLIDQSIGFEIIRVNNVTIQNTNICGFEEGIYATSSDHDTIIGNNVSKNSDAGVSLFSSSGGDVRDNSLMANNRGLAALLCSNTLVEGNTVSENNFTSGGIAIGMGIDIISCPNTLIEGNRIEANDYNVYLAFSTNDKISGNNITAANNMGINLQNSENNSICENNASANWCAINLEFSSDYNTIDSNNITDSGNGLQIYSASNNTACNNIVTANNCGVSLYNSSSNILQENDITGNSWDGVSIASSSGNTVSENNIAANNQNGIDLEWSSDYTIISGNNITNNNYGVYLLSCSDNSISGNNIANNALGIRLGSSSSNIISGNSITANNQDGVYLDSFSNYTSILGNNITNNSVYGVYLVSSSSNILSGNNITNNNYGVMVHSFSSYNIISGNDITNNANIGIGLYFSSIYNNVSGNGITNNGGGVSLGVANYNSISENSITANINYGIGLGESDNNVISENNLTNNNEGIYLYSCSDNSIFHNRFVNNTMQITSNGSANIWDDGYPSGGNYWSDYNGTDVYGGFHQNLTGSDGIGDTPYVIDSNNIDHYPVVNLSFVVQPPKLVGDLNGDGKVGLDDLVLLANAYDSKPGDPHWNSAADLAPPYGIISLTDLVTLATHYGQNSQ